ncbi:MAG: fasciclin domain-containing protein [Thiohalocapsa sp.]|nr:fasciclin domain-containing protein [Thiohalocapsa sp.]
MQVVKAFRPSNTKILIIVAALFAPAVALSLETGPRTEAVGSSNSTAQVPGQTPVANQGSAVKTKGVTWNGFVAEVLGNRLTSTVDERVSVEFFTSLFRANSWGSIPRDDGPYTLFLPVDSAFSRRSGEEIDALVHNPKALRSLVGAHMVSGRLTGPELRPGATFLSWSGTKIAADWSGTRSVNGAAVIGTAEFEHGVVHVIDRLL